jgi:hypothetical protein
MTAAALFLRRAKQPAEALREAQYWLEPTVHVNNAKACIAEAIASLEADGALEWKPTHRHYKGGLYREIARGKIEADLSPVVIYDNAHGETWVRPFSDFDSYVTIGDKTVCRFEPLLAERDR